MMKRPRKQILWTILAISGIFALSANLYHSRQSHQTSPEKIEWSNHLLNQYGGQLLAIHQAFNDEGFSAAEGSRKFLSGYTSAESVELDIRMAYRGALKGGHLNPSGQVDFAFARQYFGDETPLDHLTDQPIEVRDQIFLNYLNGTELEADELENLAYWDEKYDDWWTERIAKLANAEADEEAPEIFSSYNRHIFTGAIGGAFWLGCLVCFTYRALKILLQPTIQKPWRTVSRWTPMMGLALCTWGLLCATTLSQFVYLAAVSVSAWAGINLLESTTYHLVSILQYSVQQLGPVVFAALFLTSSWHTFFKTFRLNRSSFFNRKTWILVFGLYAAYIVFGSGLQFIERSIVGTYDTRDFLFESLIDSGKLGLISELILAAVLAPIGEEILFRGFLFSALRSKLPIGIAAFLSSLVFAVLHFYSIIGVITILAFGMLMCWVYQRVGSLWPGIIFHSLLNFTLTLSSWYLFSEDYSWLGYLAS